MWTAVPAADFDCDRDVDQGDYGIFLRCLNGANKRANPDGATQLPALQPRPLPVPVPSGQTSW
jgi:hypothetical protein